VTEKRKAIWVLALLSPCIAELLSGSAPPLEFFFPPGFLLLLGLYGAGVLVVRELSVIWGKSWGAIILLGAAYGILEEGLDVKSFFDPEWMDLGELGEYGRHIGVNWVWAFWLTIYHSAISICLPILILNLLFPQFKDERLLSEKQFRLVVAVLTLNVVFGAVIIFQYWPDPILYVLCIAVFGLLIYLARKAPRELVSARRPRPTWKPRRFLGLGLFMIVASFLAAYVPSATSIPPVGAILLLLAISALTLILLQRHMGYMENGLQMAYFVIGLLSFFIFLSFIHEVNGIIGMSGVGVAFIIFSIYLIRKVKMEMGKDLQISTVISG